MILFSCEHATDRMTDLLEGALPWPKRLAMRAHLLLCAGCRAFLRGLRAVPALVQEAFQEPPPEPAAGCASLDAVLSRIRAGEGRGPCSHPDATQFAALAEGHADLALRLLLEGHLGACPACRAAHPDLEAHAPAGIEGDGPPIPSGLRAQLPDSAGWTWYRHLLDGSRCAKLWQDGAAGASLWLVRVPSGHAFPNHRHGGDEAALLLAGWVHDGPETQGPGDFVRHGSGSEHAPIATGADGCWILARIGPGGARFSGWRRVFG